LETHVARRGKGRPDYRRLDARLIIQTIEKLKDRVSERFGDSGLAQVAGELARAANDTEKRARLIGQPYILTRLLALAAVIAWAAIQYWLYTLVDPRRLLGENDAGNLVQGVEAAVQLFILMSAGVWFLLSLEERWKRRRVQAWLHELRAFAHVIDMHQLTKDPTVILNAGPRTASSPERSMTEFQLARYLEYCAEMLALTGKLSALYAGETKDPVVVEAAGDVENLCTDLGRKVWQKIMILSELDEGTKA
jgi:hypothetical protein